jgi:hypothetical protein
MKATRIGIVVLAVVLAGCWFANENRGSAERLNVTSHRKQVGLSFRHERNDIVGFTLTGEVAMAPKETDGKPPNPELQAP